MAYGGPMIKLYIHPNMPLHWVGIDTKTNEAWLIPCFYMGWHHKQPFIGYHDRLEPAPEHCGRFLGLPSS
jgi:hypothetical protein